MIKTALISVSDKEDIVDFAKELSKLNIRILSSGGTADLLRKNKIPVTLISDYIKTREMLDGRVKTMHPKIQAGILAVRENKKHMLELKKSDILPIDIVVVDPKDYEPVMESLKNKKTDLKLKEKLALKAFGHTARYDAIINSYLREKFNADEFPEILNLTFSKKQDLRYGENPHQKAAFYLDPTIYEHGLGTMKQLHGKELSFNNILDIDNAFELVKSFRQPAATVVKHTNPSGCAIADKIEDAFKKAYEADTISAFGGVVALNRHCNKEIAEFLKNIFVEIVVCPKFEKGALEILKQKKNLRLLETGGIKVSEKGYYSSKVVGGLLAQSRNKPVLNKKNIKIVTKRKPTE